MATWQIGEITVTKVIESEAVWPFKAILPGGEDLIDGLDWLRPDFVTDEGRMHMSFHALVVRDGDSTVVVDTCAGNDKPRPGAPAFDHMNTDFLARLADAGVDRDAVDVVVCTHLHVDHVGWNTMLSDGEWVPTFPNARYLFVDSEYAHWRDEPQTYGPVFEDSVAPVMAAGLADLVPADYVVTESIRLESTPGHTPGHVSVAIVSAGERAVITGDMTHHPVQFAHPALVSPADWRQDMAHATRRDAFARWADGRTVIGTHFGGRTAGRVEAEGDAWRFTALS